MTNEIDTETSGQLFWRRWREDYQPRGLRLGQAFCNHFNLSAKELDSTIADGPNLFYQTNEAIASMQVNDFLERWGSL